MSCACCSSADSAPQRLSRCGQCKWVSYCSKACQLHHWKRGGHSKLCATLRKVSAFQDAEELFWRSRSPADLAAFTATEGLDPNSMRFYGELLFVLTGLKPCVLFSNLPLAWRAAFISDIVIPSGVLSAGSTVALYAIASNVTTPAEYPLDGTLVLANKSHIECASIEQTLHLYPVVISHGAITLPEPPRRELVVVEEAQLARVLDYPVSLHECVDPMIEALTERSVDQVGYFRVLADGSKHLLLSYCASSSASHRQRILLHFDRYQRHMDHPRTLALTMETVLLS